MKSGQDVGVSAEIEVPDQFKHVPKDVWVHHILSSDHLSLRDIKRVRASCRFFRSLADIKQVKASFPKEFSFQHEIGNHSNIFTLHLGNDEIASASSADPSIKIWSDGNKCRQTLRAHTQGITCLQRLPDNRIVSASLDKTLCIWKPEKDGYILQQTLAKHTEPVSTVTANNDFLASGSWDGKICIWQETDDGYQFFQEIPASTKRITHLAAGEGNRFFSTSWDGGVQCWAFDADTKRYYLSQTLEIKNVHCFLRLHDGSILIASGSDYSSVIELYEFKENQYKLRQIFFYDTDGDTFGKFNCGVVFSKDIFILGLDDHLFVYKLNIENKYTLWTTLPSELPGSIESLDISADELILGTDAGAVKCIPLQTVEKVIAEKLKEENTNQNSIVRP